MTHSPLPWKIDPRSPTAIFDGSGRKVAATKEGHGFIPREEPSAEADAALIVRSVNELPVLIRALDNLLYFLDNASLYDLESNHQFQPYILARAALAKAKEGSGNE